MVGTKSIENIETLLKKLERNVPDVYTKCTVHLPDNRGMLQKKMYVVNLKTGDVFRNRKIETHEAVNFKLLRAYGHGSRRDLDVMLHSYQSAQIIDGNVVLTTWVFGDHINQPETTNLNVSWNGNDLKIKDAKKGNVNDPDAIMNIVLSKPKIAAIAVVSPDKRISVWGDADRYGFMSKFGVSKDEYLHKALIRALYSANYSRHVVGIVECFKEIFKVGYVGANKYLTFDSPHDIPLFMKAHPMQIKNSKNQKRVDELTSIAIPDHSITSMTEKTICYADRVNSEWTVLRWWIKFKPGEHIETARLYVNKTESIRCCSDLKGNWVYASAKLKAITFNANRVILQYPCVLDGTKLEYFKNISTEMANQSAALYMLTTYPEFEKMYKVGLSWVCDNYLKSPWQTSWKNHLEYTIGTVDWQAKNIFKFVGANRHQIEAIGEFRKKVAHCYDNDSYQLRLLDSMIMNMKRVFNVAALNSIDNERFDYILNSITVERMMDAYVSALILTMNMYPKDGLYLIKDLNAIYDEAQDNIWVVDTVNAYGHSYRTQMTFDRLYHDVVSMIYTGGYQDTIRPRFSSADELFNHHQILVDLVNAERAEKEARDNARYESGFKKYSEKWKKWEWEGNEEFCVIAPVVPIDIANEGITLRHCVKSYIPSVSRGDTNIMFIRRKGNESEPFFTVEVDIRNNIRQVHGMCNSNASSVEGLTEFVKKWAKLKKLKYDAGYANGRRVVGL